MADMLTDAGELWPPMKTGRMRGLATVEVVFGGVTPSGSVANAFIRNIRKRKITPEGVGMSREATLQMCCNPQ